MGVRHAVSCVGLSSRMVFAYLCHDDSLQAEAEGQHGTGQVLPERADSL